MEELYKKIEELALTISEKREQVAADGHSIIIYIADSEKIKAMCVTGNGLGLFVFDSVFQDLMNGKIGEIHETSDQN